MPICENFDCSMDYLSSPENTENYGVNRVRVSHSDSDSETSAAEADKKAGGKKKSFAFCAICSERLSLHSLECFTLHRGYLGAI